MNDLKKQLQLLPDLLKTANIRHNMGIKKVTSTCISTICDIFNSCDFAKTMLPEVHKLLKVYLTIPVTTATPERSFSSLRRVKSYLHTTITEKCLNHLILLRSYKQHTDEVNITEVAEDFVECKEDEVNFLCFFLMSSCLKIKHILSKRGQPLPQQSLEGAKAP